MPGHYGQTKQSTYCTYLALCVNTRASVVGAGYDTYESYLIIFVYINEDYSFPFAWERYNFSDKTSAPTVFFVFIAVYHHHDQINHTELLVTLKINLLR
jgi:hypothetical protein